MTVAPAGNNVIAAQKPAERGESFKYVVMKGFKGKDQYL